MPFDRKQNHGLRGSKRAMKKSTILRIARSASVYVYDTLKSETSIRILELLPGEDRSLIQCRLLEVESEHAPPYDAISYAWGNLADSRLISCNGRSLKIPKNLRDALWRIRSSEAARYLWADSICINQLDLVERGHQVQQMHAIYSLAQTVLVWLGPKNHFDYFGSPEHLDHPDISSLVKKFIGTDKKFDSEGARRYYDTIPSCDDLDEDTNQFWFGFSELLKEPWFSRLWVLQEAGLGRSVLALFGDSEIEFDRLIEFYLRADHDSDGVFCSYFGVNDAVETFSLYPNRYHAHKQFGNRGTTGVAPDVDFLELLYMTQGLLASNPLDYVFALLGHPSATVQGVPIMTPDYTLSPSQLFHSIAIQLIDQTRSLRVLSAVSYSNETELEQSFWSWVPKWTRFGDSNFIEDRIGVMRAETQDFDAAAGTSGSWELVESNNILRVRGFIFDTVDEFTAPIEHRGRVSLGKSRITNLPIAAATQFRAWPEISLEERLLELCSTFISNRVTDTNQDFAADFAALRLSMSTRQTLDNDASAMGSTIPEGEEVARSTAWHGIGERYLAMVEAALGKRLFSTAGGMLGMGSHVLRKGDLCCVLFGHPVPMLLRQFDHGYKLIGPAYIHRVMCGEALVDFIIGEIFQECVFNIL